MPDNGEERGHQPQVARHRGLPREHREDAVAHLRVARVDEIVVPRDQVRELAVLLVERLRGPVEHRNHQVERVEYEDLEALELLLEPLPVRHASTVR